jgi:integral membrane sensor domain MASE1
MTHSPLVNGLVTCMTLCVVVTVIVAYIPLPLDIVIVTRLLWRVLHLLEVRGRSSECGAVNRG